MEILEARWMRALSDNYLQLIKRNAEVPLLNCGHLYETRYPR